MDPHIYSCPRIRQNSSSSQSVDESQNSYYQTYFYVNNQLKEYKEDEDTTLCLLKEKLTKTKKRRIAFLIACFSLFFALVTITVTVVLIAGSFIFKRF